ncbi:MAG TPA: hypothetical protein VFJ06_08880 [Halococcus sp.]|nr:hypothetical protein [Halococcus sp.]
MAERVHPVSAPTPNIGISYPSTRSRTNPVKRWLFAEISEWADVTLLDPNTEHPDLVSRGFDLYHMARQSNGSLADLQRACRGSVRTVNPSAGVELLTDRLRCLQRLEANCVRVPDYAYGRCEEIDLEPPVVVKPRNEIDDTCHDLMTVLDGPLEFDGERLVEKHVPGQCVKIHRLGDEIRAVATPDAEQTPPRECEPTRQMTAIAERIADVTGMTLFEVDFVGDEDLFVIDVNSAVSVSGVADGKQVYKDLLSNLAETENRPSKSTDTREAITHNVKQ